MDCEGPKQLLLQVLEFVPLPILVYDSLKLYRNNKDTQYVVIFFSVLFASHLQD